MTQEQKAKAYDEAIEKLRSLHDNYDTVSTLIDIKEELEYIFPELRESEDEMIRKALIENFKWFCGDFPETTKWGKNDELLVKDIITWLEKQGEQKSAWSEEDEGMYQNIHECLKNGWKKLPTDLLKFESWFKSIKQRIGEKNL